MLALAIALAVLVTTVVACSIIRSGRRDDWHELQRDYEQMQMTGIDTSETDHE